MELTFIAFLEIGLRDETTQEINNTFLNTDFRHFESFFETLALSSNINNERHLNTLASIVEVDSFLFHILGYLTNRRNEVANFSRALAERGISFELQIHRYIAGFDSQHLPTEELDFELVEEIGSLAGLTNEDLRAKYSVIDEYLDEYYNV